MKRLDEAVFEDFLYRFERFVDAQVGEVAVISPDSIRLTLAAQDRLRAFDWIGLDLLFEEVEEALLDEIGEAKEGVSLLFENGCFYLILGRHKSANGTKNASSFIISKSLKYQEGEVRL